MSTGAMRCNITKHCFPTNSLLFFVQYSNTNPDRGTVRRQRAAIGSTVGHGSGPHRLNRRGSMIGAAVGSQLGR